MGRRARDRLLAARQPAPGEPQPQRHHRPPTRSSRALGRALGSHRAILDGEIVAFDAARAAELRRALAAHARLLAAPGARRLPGDTGHVCDLRPAVAGRPPADRAPLHRAPPGLAALTLDGEGWQTPDHVIGHGREPLDASAAGALRASSRSRSTAPTSRAAARALGQAQDVERAGARDRRLDAGSGPPARARSARCCSA